MMHQIDFKVAGLLLLPGDALGGDLAPQPVGPLRSFLWQAWTVTRLAFEDTPDGGHADGPQFLQESRCCLGVSSAS